MSEIIPGIWHWTAPNQQHRRDTRLLVLARRAGVLIDPLPPDAVLEWLSRRPTPPTAVVLANRHHYRDSCADITERFGCQVHVPAAGMHAFTHGEPVVALRAGRRAARRAGGGARSAHSRPTTAACTSRRRARSGSPTRSCARRPIRTAGIGWVPDSLMDDPEETKRGLLAAFERILSDYEFEHLLLAHGLPLVGNGRAELEQFVREDGATARGAF